MRDTVGGDDAAYLWWRSAVGGSLGQYLIDMVAFCASDPPAYPDMTAENIQVVGVSEIFRLWMLEYLYSVTTSP